MYFVTLFSMLCGNCKLRMFLQMEICKLVYICQTENVNTYSQWEVHCNFSQTNCGVCSDARLKEKLVSSGVSLFFHISRLINQNCEIWEKRTGKFILFIPTSWSIWSFAKYFNSWLLIVFSLNFEARSNMDCKREVKNENLWNKWLEKVTKEKTFLTNKRGNT